MNLSNIIIVLARPMDSGNVGAVCRAMKNFGLSHLRWVEHETEKLKTHLIKARAVHAADIWDAAVQYKTLQEAVTDCSLVAGTTRRYGWHRAALSLTPEELARFILSKEDEANIALVFGNERTGLDDAEMDVCNLASHIPTSPDCPSLNLSHAVEVYAWELFKQAGVAPLRKGTWEPIQQTQIEALVGNLSTALETLGFYRHSGRELQEKFFRDFFSRAGITEKEAHYVKAVLNRAAALAKKARETSTLN
jgi:tRNA/rRNA methyltransferase/tRNA (cytidine32/uridine32-2'-O)-methyltransferase